MMAVAVALVITLITLATCGLFLAHPWWFPAPISTVAPGIDSQFRITLICCGLLFVLAQISLAYLAWRYRAQRRRLHVRFSRGSRALEWSWTVIVALLFLGLGWTGYRVWARAALRESTPGAQKIEVWGEQFVWYFRYPGPDGRFGPIHPNLMNDGLGNYLGLDRDHDMASRDDIVTTILAIPVNTPVELILRSKDVIHSFFVRELRLKQDAVPGTKRGILFTADRLGRYEIVCTELCGLGHYRMHAEMTVMTRPELRNWLSARAKEQ